MQKSFRRKRRHLVASDRAARRRRPPGRAVAGAVIAGIGAIAAIPAPAAAAGPTRVVFIGDSLTEICSTDFNSFRDDTLASLATAGFLVDASGTKTGGCYPTDDEHEGVAGETTGDIAARIGTNLAATSEVAAVAFLLAGTNDVQEDVATATALANIGSIIAALRAENPTVHVVIGQIPPYPSKAAQTAELNAAIVGLVANGASPVSVVDLNSSIDASHLFTDQIHLNASGAALIGGRVAAALIATGRLAQPIVLNFAPFVDETAFVSQQYPDFLGRPADAAGLAYWSGITNDDRSNVSAVIEGFMRSPEFAPRRGVARLYKAYFLRHPDIGGFDFWTQRLASGQSNLDHVSQSFVASPEFQSTYGSKSDAEFVALVYQNVLDRAPDAAGYTFWTSQMAGGMTRGQVMTRFSESPEYVGATRAWVDVVVTYRGMLNREPDLGGLAFWTQRVGADPSSLGTLISNFFSSAEYGVRVGPK